jgi:hypothetical protein
MVEPTREPGLPWTSERYEALVRDGLLGPDDSVELLEGVIVAVAPRDPAHAATVAKVADALRAAAAARGCVREQMPLRAAVRVRFRSPTSPSRRDGMTTTARRIRRRRGSWLRSPAVRSPETV